MDNNRKLYSDADFTRETNKARIETVEHYRNKGISWPTETDLMNDIINNEYKEKLPNIEFKKVVNAKNKINEAGKLVRADTYDTLIEMWNIHKIEIMSTTDKNDKTQMSIITTQPFAHYQYQQTIKAFHHLPIEVFITAGKVKADSINIAIAFDSLARTIYAGKEIATEKLKIIDTQKDVSITNPQSEL